MLIVILLNWLFTMNPMPVHDFHVSVCDIELGKDNQLQIKVKLFHDDLQSALGLKPGSVIPTQYN